MVGLVGRRPEDAQGGVALELVDPSAFGHHHPDDDGEEAVELVDHLVRAMALGEGGEVGEIDEQGGDLAHLTAEGGLGLEGVGRVALVYVVLKLVDDMILQPLTIGRSVHQHPVLVIVSILAGEQLLGVLGMFIAVPFVTMVKETIRILLERRKRGRPEAVQELEGVPQYLC